MRKGWERLKKKCITGMEPEERKHTVCSSGSTADSSAMEKTYPGGAFSHSLQKTPSISPSFSSTQTKCASARPETTPGSPNGKRDEILRYQLILCCYHWMLSICMHVYGFMLCTCYSITQIQCTSCSEHQLDTAHDPLPPGKRPSVPADAGIDPHEKSKTLSKPTYVA